MATSLLSFACILLIKGAWCEDVPSALLYNEKFTTALMKELEASTSSGNLLFSPMSVDTALGIVGYGAKEETMREIFETLGYPVNEAKHLLAEKQKIINEKPTAGATWQTANRVLSDLVLPLKKEYISEVATAFPDTEIGNLDFSDKQGVADEVNNWVSQRTNDVIKQLISHKDILGSTKLIVLNAIYFKGEWKNAFDKEATSKECFFSKPGVCTETDMMHTIAYFGHGYDKDDMKATIIELPYKNEDVSMIIVLPDEKSNLTSLMANLDVDNILKFVNEKTDTLKMRLSIPKFEIEFKAKLKDALIRMGMKRIFSEIANLSGMVAGLRAQVDNVIQKAKIQCDEEGTVAAAATAVITGDRLLIPYLVVNVDRPFAYFLRSRRAGVLFAGIKSTF